MSFASQFLTEIFIYDIGRIKTKSIYDKKRVFSVYLSQKIWIDMMENIYVAGLRWAREGGAEQRTRNKNLLFRANIV